MTAIRPRSIILPVQEEPTVFVQGFPSTRDVRIRFEDAGYVHSGLFKHIIKTLGNEGHYPRGPVTIDVDNPGEEMTMKVTVELPDREERIKKILPPEVWQEIDERIDQIMAIFHTYDLDAEPRRNNQNHNASTGHTG